ncbi:hypothetical protein J3A83DRAFT_4195699 [Scleroderma citrinum]
MPFRLPRTPEDGCYSPGKLFSIEGSNLELWAFVSLPFHTPTGNRNTLSSQRQAARIRRNPESDLAENVPVDNEDMQKGTGISVKWPCVLRSELLATLGWSIAHFVPQSPQGTDSGSGLKWLGAMRTGGVIEKGGNTAHQDIQFWEVKVKNTCSLTILRKLQDYTCIVVASRWVREHLKGEIVSVIARGFVPKLDMDGDLVAWLEGPSEDSNRKTRTRRPILGALT